VIFGQQLQRIFGQRYVSELRFQYLLDHGKKDGERGFLQKFYADIRNRKQNDEVLSQLLLPKFESDFKELAINSKTLKTLCEIQFPKFEPRVVVNDFKDSFITASDYTVKKNYAKKANRLMFFSHIKDDIDEQQRVSKRINGVCNKYNHQLKD